MITMIIFCILLIISSIVIIIEIKKYYKEKKEIMRKTNNIHIFHISILSTRGTFAIYIAIVSFIMLLILI